MESDLPKGDAHILRRWGGRQKDMECQDRIQRYGGHWWAEGQPDARGRKVIRVGWPRPWCEGIDRTRSAGRVVPDIIGRRAQKKPCCCPLLTCSIVCPTMPKSLGPIVSGKNSHTNISLADGGYSCFPTQNGQYAQLHLPSGGGMLAPDYGIPADGRRSAPPRLNKSEKRPSTGQRFFNPAS